MLYEVITDQLGGMELADSVALDLHKWMHIPFEAGCVVVRNAAAHRDSFALVPEYLQREEGARGMASGSLWFSDYGLQLTRQFRALKVWMSIKEHGLDRVITSYSIHYTKLYDMLFNSGTTLLGNMTGGPET